MFKGDILGSASKHNFPLLPNSAMEHKSSAGSGTFVQLKCRLSEEQASKPCNRKTNFKWFWNSIIIMNELIYRARLFPWASLSILSLLYLFYIPQIPVTSYLREITKKARKISSNTARTPSIEPIQTDLIYFNRQVVACSAEEILSSWHPKCRCADVSTFSATLNFLNITILSSSTFNFVLTNKRTTRVKGGLHTNTVNSPFALFQIPSCVSYPCLSVWWICHCFWDNCYAYKSNAVSDIVFWNNKAAWNVVIRIPKTSSENLVFLFRHLADRNNFTLNRWNRYKGWCPYLMALFSFFL